MEADKKGLPRTGNVHPRRAAFSLEGRVALITGASRGIGWAIARDLAHAGAHVILAGRDRTVLAERSHSLRHDGHSADYVDFDMTAQASIAEGVGRAFAAHRRIDVLVNNAGAGLRHPFVDTSDEDISRIMDTNLRGLFHLVRMVSGRMGEHGSGSIINVGPPVA